jgi:hypothetical protein
MYSWTFKNLLVAPLHGDLTDVVLSVNYRLAYTRDESRWVYHSGVATFADPDPDAFTEFCAITEDCMISFVETTLGAELDAIKAALHGAYSNPVEVRPLPWAVSDVG